MILENSYGCTMEGEFSKEEIDKLLKVGWTCREEK